MESAQKINERYHFFKTYFAVINVANYFEKSE